MDPSEKNQWADLDGFSQRFDGDGRMVFASTNDGAC
jgi:hypothetical protein